MNRFNYLFLLVFVILFSHTALQAEERYAYQTFWTKNKKIVTSFIESVFVSVPTYTDFTPTLENLYFFDFDHTLSDSNFAIPILLNNKIIRSVDSKCIGKLRVNEFLDYSVFDRNNLYQSKTIPSVFSILRMQMEKKESGSVILTARSAKHNFSSLVEYLALNNAEANAVFPIHSLFMEHNLWNQIQFENFGKQPSGFKKSILIAGIISYLEGKKINLKSVHYYEDTDSYLKQAMLFLPDLFPNIQFHFFDIIRDLEPKAGYTLVKVAYSKDGKIFKTDHTIFEREEIDAYDSKDCR